MNLCTFIGRTTKDIEVKETQSGKTFAKFTLAVDSSYGESRKSNFFNMTVWNRSAVAMQEYVKKGTKIAVTCEANQNTYTDKNGNKVSTVDFTVRNWEFAQGKGENVEQINDTPSSPTSSDSPITDNSFMDIPDTVGDDYSLPFV